MNQIVPIDYKITEWFSKLFNGNGWGVVLFGVVCLLITIFCSGALGFEREYRGHSAGLRTHVLVAVGSCLIMYISMFGFGGLNATTRDPARLAAQVVTGVGFLGAGTIIQNGSDIKGLTTATTIWSSMAIGLCAGSGNLIICIFATLIMLFVLVSLRRVERVASRHNPMIIIVCSPNQPILKEILQVANRFSINIKETESQLINYQNEQYIRVSIRIAPARESAINEFIDEIKLTSRPLDIKISTEF